MSDSSYCHLMLPSPHRGSTVPSRGCSPPQDPPQKLVRRHPESERGGHPAVQQAGQQRRDR